MLQRLYTVDTPQQGISLEMVLIAPRVLTFQVAAGTKLCGPKFHSTPTDRKMMSAATSQAKGERWHQK